MTWLAVVGLAAYGVWSFQGIGLFSLLAFPLAAASADLAFQKLRFPHVRFPDAALATGSFLAVLLPPTVLPLYGVMAALAAIGSKHLLRSGGRPFLNPAAGGVVLAVLAFGLLPAWWVGIDLRSEIAMAILGALLIARSPATWRLAPSFLFVFAPFSIVLKAISAAAFAPKILLLTILDPGTLFFGLFMVTEPRSAPANPRLHGIYGALVAFGAVFLPVILPSTGVLMALVLVGLGNGIVRTVVNRWFSPNEADGAEPGLRGHGRRRRNALKRRRPDLPVPTWTMGRRVSVGLFLVLALATVPLVSPTSHGAPSGLVPVSRPAGSGSTPSPTGSAGGGSSGVGLAVQCTQDNPSIAPSTLNTLHNVLGPSVVRSYDPNTGATVFYDPVNQVTVTETDLYEDFGYAEFNGDDFAVSGCSP
ncbi:MAG: RnfABCDGE type electron transport complex subunit D [Thermoplasmata archaeon]|nr:RnfABCDGE type electron transport complex subunit D [Thermoplasmata archaeon]